MNEKRSHNKFDGQEVVRDILRGACWVGAILFIAGVVASAGTWLKCPETIQDVGSGMRLLWLLFPWVTGLAGLILGAIGGLLLGLVCELARVLSQCIE
jgi:hypothetical protein